MIEKPLDQITHVDLQYLIDNKIPESKTVEYKRELPENTESGKHDLLSAVSAFANTEGGDLLYGIEAKKGIPVAITGIGQHVEDTLRLELESRCRTGIEPRLPKLDFRFVATPGGKTALLIRIAKSWSSPHRVIVGKGGGHFYGRHSAGKFPMDTLELRNAFLMSQSVIERITNFLHGQINKIHNHHTPIPIHKGCKIALHIVPLSAFTSTDKIDLANDDNRNVLMNFHPIGSDSFQNSKINLEGIIYYTNINNGRSRAYTQIFRKGVVEAVHVIPEDGDGHKLIHKGFEKPIIQAVNKYLKIFKRIELSPPFYLFLSFIGVSEFKLVANLYEEAAADRDIIVLPEIVITDTTLKASRLLKPVFDMAWNAFGYPASQDYDADGNWKGHE